MRIGELARRADCPVETVRFYEKQGLLASPRRSGANYREFGTSHLERLAFIRRCRALDMSLPEIRGLIEAIERPGADCGPVDRLLEEHIEHVAARIADLTELKGELDAIRAHCAGGQPAKACGIVETLSRQSRPRGAARSRSHVRGAK